MQLTFICLTLPIPQPDSKLFIPYKFNNYKIHSLYNNCFRKHNMMMNMTDLLSMC